MGLWIEQNLPALFGGAGLGSIITHWFFPEPLVWMIGAVVGIAVAVPIWQIINRPKER